MISRMEAVKLTYRQEVYYAVPPVQRANGMARAEKHIVCRVNGKTFLSENQQFRVPLKIGFNGHADITESNNQLFHLPGTCPCRECAK
jgi:hypothetical protein